MSRQLTMNPAFLPPQTNGVLKALLEKPLKLPLHQDEGDQTFHFVTLQSMGNNNFFVSFTVKSCHLIPAAIYRINSHLFLLL